MSVVQRPSEQQENKEIKMNLLKRREMLTGHGPKGEQADSIGVSTCASCHEHDDTHSQKYLKTKN